MPSHGITSIAFPKHPDGIGHSLDRDFAPLPQGTVHSLHDDQEDLIQNVLLLLRFLKLVFVQ